MNAPVSLRYLQDQFESVPDDPSDDPEYVAPEMRAEIEFDTMEPPAQDWLGDGNALELQQWALRAAIVADATMIDAREADRATAIKALRAAYILYRAAEIEQDEHDEQERMAQP